MVWRAWAARLGRDGVVALGTGLGGAGLAAAAAAARVASEQNYFAAGYLRLIVAEACTRLDVWGPAAAAALLVLLSALRIMRLPELARPGVLRVARSSVVAVVGLRALAAADAWRVSAGPNLLLISIDTLRADRLGTYGYDLPTSPTIDRRLAAEGVTFEDVYSQSPKTTPSHMTMLTSLYPSVHGVEMWEDGREGRVLAPAVHTLAEVLKNAGYATAAFTGGGNVHRARGFDQGFDRYKHSQQLKRATRWITEHRRRKFFVFFHTYDVHDPYVPPQPLIARFAPDYQGPVREAVERVRAGVGGWDQAHRLFWASLDTSDPRDVAFVSRLYDAAIRHMDEATVAPLLDLLDTLGLAHDTLIVLTSDHGEAFGEHGVFQHDDLYAGTLRVPLILRFPGRLPSGQRVTGRARLVDLMPTVLELLGLRAPTSVEGESLIASMRGGDDGAGPRTAVSEYSNTAIGRVFESVRRERLGYIVDGAHEELFDIADDPGERVNLITARPAAALAMRAELARWREDCRARATRIGPAGGATVPDEKTRRQLRALGYVQGE